MTDIENVPVPERMQSLPVSAKNGLPIPFFAANVPGSGRDPKLADPQKLSECYLRDLCWCCGKPLKAPGKKYRGAFIGGPLSILNLAYTDLPSHIECAEYAAQVCPFLTRPKYAEQVGDGMKGENAIEGNPVAFGIVQITERPHLAPGPTFWSEAKDVRRVDLWAHGERITFEAARAIWLPWLEGKRDVLVGLKLTPDAVCETLRARWFKGGE